MKKVIYSTNVYDYKNPVLGNLNVLRRLSSDGKHFFSDVHIIKEVTDKGKFLNLIEKNKDEVYLDKMSENILATASLDKKCNDDKEINLSWIETQKSARGKGLAKLALALGVSQVNLAKDAILHAVFDDEGSEWNQRVRFYDSLGFDNVPEEKNSDFPESLAMTVNAAKLKTINLNMLKPNKQLTKYIMDYQK